MLRFWEHVDPEAATNDQSRSCPRSPESNDRQMEPCYDYLLGRLMSMHSSNVEIESDVRSME